MNTPVLVLNQNYEPLNICTARRALVMLFAGKAEALTQADYQLTTTTNAFTAPSVIRLTSFVRRPRPRVKLTRREIFMRDNYTCQYCGARGHDLTIDHVIPRSRGGLHSWDNVVCACRACNHRKGGKSVAEARMSLHVLPHEPRASAYYVIERRLDASIRTDWHQFLPELDAEITESWALPERRPSRVSA